MQNRSPEDVGQSMYDAIAQAAPFEQAQLLQQLHDLRNEQKVDMKAEYSCQVYRLGFLIYTQEKLLHAAAKQGLVEVMTLLLKWKADIEAKTWLDNKTPLMLAAEHGCTEAVRFLLANGANKDARDCNDRTALSLAAYHGEVGAIRELLSQNASVESEFLASNQKFYTDAAPLLMAIEGSMSEEKHDIGRTVKALLDGDANVHITNWNSETAYGKIVELMSKPETSYFRKAFDVINEHTRNYNEILDVCGLFSSFRNIVREYVGKPEPKAETQPKLGKGK